MRILRHTVQDEYGLHARPASQMAEICRRAQSEILPRCAERSAGGTRPAQTEPAARQRPGHAPNAQLDNETGVNRMRRNYKCLIYP